MKFADLPSGSRFVLILDNANAKEFIQVVGGNDFVKLTDDWFLVGIARQNGNTFRFNAVCLNKGMPCFFSDEFEVKFHPLDPLSPNIRNTVAN